MNALSTPIRPDDGATGPLSLALISAAADADQVYCAGIHPDTRPVTVAAFMVLADHPVGWGVHAAFIRWLNAQRAAHREQGITIDLHEWIAGQITPAAVIANRKG